KLVLAFLPSPLPNHPPIWSRSFAVLSTSRNTPQLRPRKRRKRLDNACRRSSPQIASEDLNLPSRRPVRTYKAIEWNCAGKFPIERNIQRRCPPRQLYQYHAS